MFCLERVAGAEVKRSCDQVRSKLGSTQRGVCENLLEEVPSVFFGGLKYEVRFKADFSVLSLLSGHCVFCNVYKCRYLLFTDFSTVNVFLAKFSSGDIKAQVGFKLNRF